MIPGFRPFFQQFPGWIFPGRRMLVLFAMTLCLGRGAVAETDSPPSRGFWTRAAWYLPNRVLDLADILRARVKVGPGLAAGARVSDYFSFYTGRAHSVYLGLPGPRGGLGPRPLWGLEQSRGLVVLGVDATDDLPYAPVYGTGEIGVSLHALLVGAEVTLSPEEFLDFLGGWIGLDPSRDDAPRRPELLPVSFPRPVIGPVLVEPAFPLDPKPEAFDGIAHRLDFVAENVPRLIRSELQAVDRWLIGEREAALPQPPVRDLRLSLHYEWISGPRGSQDLRPELDLQVELPNVEHLFSIFILSSYDDDLPGTDEVDRQDEGWSIGLRRQFDKWNISSDIGVHSGWRPELFAKASWDPRWTWGAWDMGFEQRLFWENEDGFGLLSSLRGYRWIGEGGTILRNLTAGRFSEATEGYEWQHTWTIAHMRQLVDERRRLDNQGIDDALSCTGWKASVFGNDRLIREYRAQVVFRKPVHGDFVVLEVEPGLQWRNDRDWTTQYRLDAGIVLIF
jgi:hypothetical protein